VRVLLAEYCHQDVGAGHFLLAGGLNVQDSALNHALETERRLGINLLGPGHGRSVFSDEAAQALAQLVDVGGAGAQHLGSGGIVKQREQQVLDRDELMALLPRFDKGHVQADFKFLRNHSVSSITH
jgi:hypothetical protein